MFWDSNFFKSFIIFFKNTYFIHKCHFNIYNFKNKSNLSWNFWEINNKILFEFKYHYFISTWILTSLCVFLLDIFFHWHSIPIQYTCFFFLNFRHHHHSFVTMNGFLFFGSIPLFISNYFQSYPIAVHYYVHSFVPYVNLYFCQFQIDYLHNGSWFRVNPSRKKW